MYAPVPSSATTPPAASSSSSPSYAWLLPSWRFILSTLMFAALVGVLVVTYDSCVGCVIVVALISLLLMSVVPLMPVVFLVSVAVLLYHAIDYRTATVRVEVPLQNLVYVPTYDDVRKYVHLAPNTPAHR
jgi:hypothetical protein